MSKWNTKDKRLIINMEPERSAAGKQPCGAFQPAPFADGNTATRPV
jgi:hypothetical protein